LLKKHKKRY